MKKIKTKKKSKRISLPKIIRLSIIGIITLILLFSIIQVYTAYNKPETTKITYETLNYNHNSNFDYRVYLKDNTLYEGKEYLKPGEGKYFNKIIDRINASFTYSFLISKTAKISGYYSLDAEIQTSQWTKKYKLIPTKSINSNGTKINIFEEFPINYQYYEEIINQINEETGIKVTSSYLIYKFDIFLSMNIDGEKIVQSYTPSMNITLGGNEIQIPDDISDANSGAKTETQEIFHQEVIDERNNWTIYSVIILIILIIISIITKSKIKKPSIEKTVNKIMKKNGEWIVEVEKPVKELKFSKLIYCKTIDDLMKISEQLGKPVIYVQQDKNNHTFYISENSTCYQYKIKKEE